MSGAVPRVTFDGGGEGVYLSYIHLLPDFIHGYTSRLYTYGGISNNTVHRGAIYI